MERLPPTQDALLQHTKRVAFQAGIWYTSEQIEQHAPTPEGWAGLSMRTAINGFLCGTCYLWSPRSAVKKNSRFYSQFYLGDSQILKKISK